MIKLYNDENNNHDNNNNDGSNKREAYIKDGLKE